MLGWLDHAETGGGNACHLLMRDLAVALADDGIAVRGAVQVNDMTGDDCHCAMTLSILGDDGPDVVISQDLGPESKGCRLDTGALEAAAQRVLDSMGDADILFLNKFGKQELFGRGMVSVIAAAMGRDLPVLISVAPEQRDGFLAFAEGMAVRVPAEQAGQWCRQALNPQAA